MIILRNEVTCSDIRNESEGREVEIGHDVTLKVPANIKYISGKQYLDLTDLSDEELAVISSDKQLYMSLSKMKEAQRYSKMKNLFFIARGLFMGVILSGLLLMTITGSASAADDVINGSDGNITDSESLTYTTSNTGTLTQDTNKTTINIADGVTGILATTSNDYNLTATGALILTATGTNDNGLTVTDDGAIEIQGGLSLAGSGKVTSIITSAAGGIDFSAGGTNFASADRNLRINGTGDVNLGAITMTGFGHTIELHGSTVTTASTDSGNALAIMMHQTAQLITSGEVNAYTFYIYGTNTIDTTGGAFTITDKTYYLHYDQASVSLTIQGTKGADLGETCLDNKDVVTITNNDTKGVDTGAITVTGGADATTLTLAGTRDYTTDGNTINITAAGAGATTMTVNGSGKFTGGAANITASNTGVAKLNIAGSGTNTIGAVTLSGTNADTAILQTDIGAIVSSLEVTAGKFGTLDYNHANTTISTINANGSFTADMTGANWTLASGNIINIASTGSLTATGGSIDLETNGGKLVIDLGTDVASANNYATITGANSILTTDGSGSGTITEVYGMNGIVGEIYDVFDAALDGGTVVNGDFLNTDDAYRTYIVSNNSEGDANRGITVSVNSVVIDSEVFGNGGNAEDAQAASYLLNHEGDFDKSGQSYVRNMTKLSGSEFVHAIKQTIGEEATAQTSQTSILSVQASKTAVSNQMTSFRSGNIASGMASSFNSGGATAALSDMADAETLAEAYEAGFTSGSDCTVYKKVQVWANGFGGFGEQGTDGNMTGYDFWNIGTMVGLDYAFAKELRVGALFGYSYNKTDVYWNSGDSTDNLLRFGAYASYNWDNFFVDLSPTIGVHILESKRNIWNGATAKGDRTGVDFNISGTVGYTFNLPADIQLTPSYSLGYTLFYDPEYTETGAGAANLNMNSFTSNSLLQDLGVRIGKLIRCSDDLAFLPEVWGGWEIEYLNTGGTRNSTTTQSIGAQTYGTNMNGMAENRGYWGVGLTALIKDNVSVFGRYDQKIWDKGYNVGFTAGVKVGF